MSISATTDPPTDRAYLTKQELVARSGLSAATVQRYKDSGRIPFYQPGGKGGRILFPLDAIETAQRDRASNPPCSPASSEPVGTPNAVGINPPKLPGPRPRWQTNPQPK